MQTARILEFPVTIKESIILALREARDLSKRQFMNSYIKQLLKLCRLREIKISRPGYRMQIYLKDDGELLYDIRNYEALSLDGNCPGCGQHFDPGATILYIHPGLNIDKVIFACQCGAFYAHYARKED